MFAPFAAAPASLLFTLRAIEMLTAFARFGFFWAATLYLHDAGAATNASAPSISPHIYRCPQPMELWITLENTHERRSFPGFVCGDSLGEVSIQSEVDTPGHDVVIDGNYRTTASGLSLTLRVERKLPDEKVEQWAFSGADLATDGTPKALSGAPTGSDLKVIVAINPAKANGPGWLSVHFRNVPVAEILSHFVAVPGLSIAGLKHVRLDPAPLTMQFPITEAEMLLALQGLCDCEFQRSSESAYRALVLRDWKKLSQLMTAAEQTSKAITESTSADDPAWAKLMTQLEAIRTLTRPRKGPDIAPSADDSLRQLARLYQHRGANDLSVAVLRDVLSDAQRRDLRPNASSVANARALLGAALLRAGKALEGKQQLAKAAANLDLKAVDIGWGGAYWGNPYAVELLGVYAKLGMTNVTSAQLHALLLQLEAYPKIDNAKNAWELTMAARSGTDALRYDAQSDPVIAVFTQWVADGVGNERLDWELNDLGMHAFDQHQFESAAQLLSIDSLVRANARLRPEVAEVIAHRYTAVSQLMLGDYAQAALALERLIGLELAWHKSEAIVNGTAFVNSAALRDLRLLYTAANEPAKASQSPAQLLARIERQSQPRRSLPILDSDMSEMLNFSIFWEVPEAQKGAHTTAQTTQARIAIENALALAKLAASDYIGAQTTFATTQPSSISDLESRAAWFARVKQFAMKPAE